MIAISDNAATDVLLHRLERTALNERMAEFDPIRDGRRSRPGRPARSCRARGTAG